MGGRDTRNGQRGGKIGYQRRERERSLNHIESDEISWRTAEVALTEAVVVVLSLLHNATDVCLLDSGFGDFPVLSELITQ